MVEVLIALAVMSTIISVLSVIVINSISLNSKATIRSDASSLAFKKVQDYINLSFDNIPIGDTVTAYEVEDFSAESQAINLVNSTAKVYVEPESVLQNTTTTTTTNYSQIIDADSAFINGSEISSVGVNDATGDYWRTWRIRDDNFSNYTYNRYNFNPDNLASPSIDLGSSSDVDTIRVDWYSCGYGANNFRVEAKNSSPNSNSGWTTITSGLSDNGIPCGAGSHPQDIDVSSNTTQYRYWRLYIVDAQNFFFNVFSELEAFSAGSPGDIVEQQGSDATDSPGSLYFSSSDLQMSIDGVRGHQSLGIIFDSVNTPQASTIDSAYIEFTPDQTGSTAVSLLVKGVDTDNASPWAGLFSVDNSVDTDNSDGLVGTSASTAWSPGAWTVGSSGIATQVDVKDIIQEIVDRTGWSVNNSLAFAIQYVSGSGVRVAERSPAPKLVINWSETVTTTSTGGYLDVNMDGDVDNPTLVRVTAIIDFKAVGVDQEVVFTSYVRKYGIGN